MDKLKFFKYAYGCDPDIMPDVVIVTPFISLEKFGEHCDISRKFRGRMYSGAIAAKNGREIGLIRCGIGDRLLGDAVLLLEEAQIGKLVFTGSCASIGGSAIGDLVVGKSAMNGEGFTRYVKDDFNIEHILNSEITVKADNKLTEEIMNFLEKVECAVQFSSKDVFTIGSIVSEERHVLEAIGARQMTAIEMELSAVYQAAEKTGIKATSLLWVSDLPLEKPLWEEIELEDKRAYNKGMNEAIRLSIEFAAWQKDN